jgi:membrane fusion protein (multidrug efflux system)
MPMWRRLRICCPGAAFKAQITVGHFDGFVVPRDEVLSDAKGAYVFQIGDGKAHRVAVTIAGSTGDQTAVTGAIDPAKPIVLQGNYQLEDGMEVRLSETETSAAGPASPVEQ